MEPRVAATAELPPVERALLSRCGSPVGAGARVGSALLIATEMKPFVASLAPRNRCRGSPAGPAGRLLTINTCACDVFLACGPDLVEAAAAVAAPNAVVLRTR